MNIKQIKAEHKLNKMKVLKKNSRIQNENGQFTTEKEYKIEYSKPLKFGFFLIKIGGILFKTDYKNIIEA